MRISSVTFSIARSIPLQTLTGRPDDAYANVKPMSSVTVDVDEQDDVKAALKLAQDTAFMEVTQFSQELRKLLKRKE